VKPIHLNLAARPYRDERPFIAVVVVGSLLIAFLTLMNFDAWYRYRNETRSTRAKIASLEEQTRVEQQKTQVLNQRLRTVDVKTLSLQTQFANARLAERAFSWSELLDNLEHVLPDYVRIETINPSFRPDGMVGLTMQCVARDPDGLVRTMNQLNADPRFSNPFPNGEEHTDQGYRFNIHVDYRPSTSRPVS
jgi:type IV pilus assembly protein PilN